MHVVLLERGSCGGCCSVSSQMKATLAAPVLFCHPELRLGRRSAYVLTYQLTQRSHYLPD